MMPVNRDFFSRVLPRMLESWEPVSLHCHSNSRRIATGRFFIKYINTSGNGKMRSWKFFKWSLPYDSIILSKINMLHMGFSQSRRGWLLLLILAAAGTSYYFYPRHNYPPEVAAEIRLALRAENEDELSYERAILHCAQALKLARSLHMDVLSDEYTGLQIKLGELFEKSNKNIEAVLVYSEICTSYAEALRSEKRLRNLCSGSEEEQGLIDHILSRYIRVMVRASELLADSLDRPLEARVFLAQQLDSIQPHIYESLRSLIIDTKKNFPRDEQVVLSLPGYTIVNNEESVEFTEEILAARDCSCFCFNSISV